MDDDVFKRNLFNKMENLARTIKSKMQTSLGPEQKKHILSLITLMIISFEVDSLYTKTTNKSGIIELLKILGIGDKRADKIKSVYGGGVSIAILSLIIYNNLKK